MEDLWIYVFLTFVICAFSILIIVSIIKNIIRRSRRPVLPIQTQHSFENQLPPYSVASSQQQLPYHQHSVNISVIHSPAPPPPPISLSHSNNPQVYFNLHPRASTATQINTDNPPPPYHQINDNKI